MARKKYINKTVRSKRVSQNRITFQAREKNVQRKIKEADSKLNIVGKNIFIWCKMLFGF